MQSINIVYIKILAGGIVLLCSNLLWAQTDLTSKADNRPASRIVVVSENADTAEVQPIESAIVAQLADLPVEVNFLHVTQPIVSATDTASNGAQDELLKQMLASYNADAVFLVLPADFESLTIAINTDGQIAVVRRLVESTEGILRHEALALIVRAAVATMLARKDQRQELPPASTMSPEPEKTTSSPHKPESSGRSVDNAIHRRFSVDAGASLTWMSKDTGLFPSLLVGIGWVVVPHWRVQLKGAFFSEGKASARETTLVLKRHPVFAGVQYFQAHKRMILGGSGAVCVDYVTERISTRNANISLEKGTHTVAISMVFLLHMQMQLLRPLGMFIDLGLSVPIRRAQYDIRTPEGRSPIIETRSVQPVMMFGVQYDFF